MIKVGICSGYWGPNLYRNFAVNPKFVVAAVSDPIAECREKACRFDHQLALFADARELIDSGNCDAVAIAARSRRIISWQPTRCAKACMSWSKSHCARAPRKRANSLPWPSASSAPFSSTTSSSSTMPFANSNGS